MAVVMLKDETRHGSDPRRAVKSLELVWMILSHRPDPRDRCSDARNTNHVGPASFDKGNPGQKRRGGRARPSQGARLPRNSDPHRGQELRISLNDSPL